MSATLFAGRYEPVRSLKRGNGVDTILARDTASPGTDVVIKIIDPAFVNPAARLRFEHETQVLRELTALGACSLYDAGHHGDRLFLAQTFVPGETLDEILRRGPLHLHDALRVGIDVAIALEVAHGAGVCHRDVKPANVIVDWTEPVATVALVDFGFARSRWLDESIRDDLVGTVRYLAPESAGSLASPADERSDLYAVGVVLFECLTGRPPFPGPTVGDLLRQHVSMPVPHLRARGEGIPRAVEDIVHRLLRKDPAERYQSASALAADLTATLRALQAGDPDPRIVIGRLDQRRSLTDPSFVGRDAEVEALDTFIRELADGGSGLLMLEADSGGGKSRLLDEVSRRAVESRITVLHGQGTVQAGQRPFTLLLGVIDELMLVLDADPDTAAREAIVADLRDVAADLVRAIPALSALLGTPPAGDSGPEQFGELRSLAGLRRLLVAVATEQRPVLLVLDDCQWADTLTVRLFAELFPPGSLPPYLGLIAAFRSEEVPPEHKLRNIVGSKSLSLGPLSALAMTALAESMGGPLPDEITETVVRLADGNPFMGAAVLRGLVESGALVAVPEGWSVDESGLRDVQAARRSAAFLVRRLELLSAEALRLLSAGAVLGKKFDIAAAVAIADTAAETAAIISDARRRRLLWVDECTGICTFFHDKIREALLERLTAESRRDLHSRAADYLAARNDDADAGDVVFDLAYHLDAAGRYAEAAPRALESAVLSRARYALDAAAAHYRMAARGCREDDVETRVILAEGLGDVLTLQGVYGEAGTRLVEARSLVTEPARAAELDGKLGDLAFKQGDIPTGKRHLEGALALLGRRIPRRGWLTIALLWELLVQAAHTIAPRLLVGRRNPRGRDVDFLAMHLYSRLAYLYWFHSGKVSCAWSHLRGMNLAERYPPSAELGQAYSEHAPVMTMLPWYSRGIRYAERSLAIRRGLGDPWGEGQSLAFTGVATYAASQFVKARECCEQAIRLLRRTGDQWEVNTAAWNLALCHWRLGDLNRAADLAREVFESARAIGDQTAAGISLSIWARSVGLVDPYLIHEQLANGSEDSQTTVELHLALALNRRANGDIIGAKVSIDTALDLVHAAGLRQEYIAPVFPWAATISREIAESASGRDPRARARLVKQAVRAARRSRVIAVSYRNNQPHALRESALVASLRGRRGAAARLLRRSIVIAERQGAQYEAALSHAAHAELLLTWGGSQPVVERAHEERAAADIQLNESVVVAAADVERPTLSIFDRFSSLLNVGRAITAATSYPALESAIRDAALTLLRAERCHLVPVAAVAQERLTTQSGEDLYGMSRSLLARAVETAAPAVALEQSADPNESLLLSGIRSAIAVPIMVAGEPTTCLYATHREIGRLFGDEEIQLAAFIATLAGAAFEHLAGSETRFRSLAQNSSDVITLVDGAGVVSYQSSAVNRVFALHPTTMLGRPITEWVHSDDLGTFTTALASAGTVADTRIECRLRHADGSFLVSETTVTNLLAEPTVAALVLNTRDVTDRTRAEEQLREKNVELEKAGRAKDMFLASMSHELRTPLNAIIGFTGTLLMELPGPLNTEQNRQLRTVQQSGQHLLAIINDLLDLAKIESGAVQLALENIDCVQVVQTVLTALQPLADAKSLPIKAELPPEPILVRSDARALGQILINLVNNAIKFTDSGQVSVDIDRNVDGRARIIVSDTGPGIDTSDLARIFNAFERGLVHSGGHPEGTGLGLHICQKLAELIDAEITVASALGGGSQFSILLAEEVAS